MTTTNSALSSSSQPWHQKMQAANPSPSYNYGPEFKDSDAFKDFFSKTADQLSDKIEKLTRLLPARFIRGFTGENSILMQIPGVAVIASYLRRKHNLQHLHVCSSYRAFKEKLDQIGNSQEDVRCGIILPEVGHKMSVCIEKKGSDVRVVLFDSLGIDTIEISSTIVSQFLPTVNVLNIIQNSTIKNPKIYISSLARQKTGYSCESYALRDTVEFLKDPQFFDKISIKEITIPSEGKKIKMHLIRLLPPAHMKGMQSLPYLKGYERLYLRSNRINAISDLKALRESTAKHTIALKDSGKKQNHYIQHRSLKHHLLLLKALELTPASELQKIVNETLLSAPESKL